MGQSQSSSSDSQNDPETPLKRDYYELLSVERTATEDEIKKSYRRKALELHPDRNFGNEEGATRLFAEVQAAYEVLSDPQERAWYDSHRDVLLRGDTVGEDGGISNAGNFAYGGQMTGTEEVLKLMMRFNSRIDFTDAPSGFYGGLNEFFAKLAKEEDIAAQWEDVDGQEYPEFGGKEDDYEHVVRPFYAVWNGFATTKSYAWKDKWKLSDAPDRRIRRLMEKDNKKLRDEAAYEFNDAVRSLVAFVRKRDPRVANNQKSEAERQKSLKDLAAAQAARSKAQREAELQSFDLPAWAQSRDQGADEHEGGFSSEEEQEQHEYDCVVCDKTFKSEKQLQAHEKSKKHIKLLKELKRDMKKEGRELDLEQEEFSSAPEALAEGDVVRGEHENSGSEGDGPDRNSEIAASSEAGNTLQASSASETSSAEGDQDVDSDYAPRDSIEKRLTQGALDSETEDLESITSGLKGTTIPDVGTGTPATSDADLDAAPNNGLSSGQSKLGKAKQKRAKKAAAAGLSQGSKSIGTVGGDNTFRCAVCQADFPSNSKLFKHIQEKDHAAPVAQLKGSGTKGGKGKKR